MRINIWIVLAILLVLLAVTRLEDAEAAFAGAKADVRRGQRHHP
jgi:hypothetical protein